jgi:hypothetical protein
MSHSMLAPLVPHTAAKRLVAVRRRRSREWVLCRHPRLAGNIAMSILSVAILAAAAFPAWITP